MKYIKNFENTVKKSKYTIDDIVIFNDNSTFFKNYKFSDDLFKIVDIDIYDNVFYYKIRHIIDNHTISFIPENTINAATDDDLKNFMIKKDSEKYNI